MKQIIKLLSTVLLTLTLAFSIVNLPAHAFPIELPKLPEPPSIELPKLPEPPSIELPKLPEPPSIELPKLPEPPSIELPKLPELPSLPIELPLGK